MGMVGRGVANIVCVVSMTCLLAAPLAAQTTRPQARQEEKDQNAAESSGRPTFRSPSFSSGLLPYEFDRDRYLSLQALEVPIDPDTYVLGPLDVLLVMIVVGEVRTERLPVLPEGVVVVPNIESLPAAGKTLSEFRQDLRRAVRKRYQNFELYCHLAEARQFRIYVTGEVQQAGTAAGRAYERVSDIIERSGGFTEQASRRNIELRSPNGDVTPVDLGTFYTSGDLRRNPFVRDGQVIFVPVRRQEIELRGALGAPGLYEFRQDDSLARLIELAGGFLPQADTDRVTIDVLDEHGSLHVRQVETRQAAETIVAKEFENAVRVSVDSKLTGKRRVFVIHPDGEKESLYLSQDETLGQLVLRIPEVSPLTNISSVVLASRRNGTSTHETIDLLNLSEEQAARPIQDGDVLSFPMVREDVYVSGFVPRPGRYDYRGEWTVNDYVGEAGGTSSGGNLRSAILLRPDGSKRKVGRGEPVHRGDTIYIDRSTGAKVASGLAILSNLSALIISIVVLTRP